MYDACMRVLSGIQPTGRKHLGNYLGALRHWVDWQQDNDALYCVVDLHALTVLPEPDDLRASTRSMAAFFLAIGLDPDRCSLFLQSHVAGPHSELAWLLSCVASYGELTRMTQFKDKSESRAHVSAGLFTYPVLMASDILLYHADAVPIGDDQRQHLELTRNIAERFNNRYGDTFRVPDAVISEVGARIMDLQEPTRKMSTTGESDKGTVYLLDEPSAIAKKIRSAVTDTGSDVRCASDKPGVTNLIHILSAITGQSIEDIETEYGSGGYGAFKQAVADAVVSFVEPVQERYHDVMTDPGYLDQVLARGADRAHDIASETVRVVSDRMGLVPPAR